MIPILYDSTETAFVSNGLGRLRDAVAVRVVEERNSIYECDFDYPVDGAHFDEIIPGRIIAVTHDDTGTIQPFDIVSYSRPINGIVTFHAVHISYRLTGQTVWSSGIYNSDNAIALFNGVSGTPFTFSADYVVNNTYMAAADGTPRTVRQMMGGIEGSFIDAYGGEWEFDKWNVIAHKSRGEYRDFAIRYGINLIDYQEDVDYFGTYTSCVPFWRGNVDGKDVIVRGNRADADLPSYTGRRAVVPLDLSDKFENKPTATQLQTMALAMMNANQTNMPSQSISVDFIRLQDTPEYAAVSSLLACSLCDTVDVIFPMYNQKARFKIVRVEWDALADRYISMELGTLSTTLAEALGITETPTKQMTGTDLAIAGDLTVGGSITSGGTITAGNAITSAGHIYAEGNGTWIGYQTDAYETTQNMATGTSWITTGRTISLSKGTWLIEGEIAFASNSTGRRGACVQVPSGVLVKSQHTETAINGAATRIATSACVVLTGSSNTTVSIYGFQNSGGQLSATTTIQATRIA